MLTDDDWKDEEKESTVLIILIILLFAMSFICGQEWVIFGMKARGVFYEYE